MIVTELYDGQGFGNQLWAYVFTRVLALDKNVDFGIQNPQRFKGSDFMHLDMGLPVNGGSGPEGGPPTELPEGIKFYYSERAIRHPENDVDIRTVDPGFQDVVDNTKIEGVFQAEDYILHRKEEIRIWLNFRPKELDLDFTDPNICVINFRGGEYARNAKIFLRRRYWCDAIAEVRRANPNVRFVVITDDPSRAQKFFPRFEIRHYGIHGDYQAINSARYLILSNSSFAFFPAWLNPNVQLCIAPKYWSAHNDSDGYWGCSYNVVKGWMYLDRRGLPWDCNQCVEQLREYCNRNPGYFQQKKVEKALLVVSSFNNDLSWLPRYTNNYAVFEQGAGSGIPPQLDLSKVRMVSHSGSNFRDYFTYIIDNYESLPALIFLVKGNVFPRHLRQHVFDSFVSKSAPHVLVDRELHSVRFPAAFFNSDGRFCELNSDWFANSAVSRKYFQSVDDILEFFCPGIRKPMYNKFALAGQLITTGDSVRSLPKSAYEVLLKIVTHDGTATGYTLEAYLVERALDKLWTLGDVVLLTLAGQPELRENLRSRSKRNFRSVVAIFISYLAKIGYIITALRCLTAAIANRTKLVRNHFSGIRFSTKED